MEQGTKVEFAVQMHGEECAAKITKVLQGLGQVEIDVKEGRVIIETDQPWSVLQDCIESTGMKAVLVGFGGQSAVAMISSTGSDMQATLIQGVIRFSAIHKSIPGVVVDGTVDGLSPGLHGLHIHETGDISEGCDSVGEHYNPRKAPHGGPCSTTDQRHAGDLGNIHVDSDGRATFRFVDSVLELWEIIGRAVVITEKPDDLGQGPNHQSLIDGNSGERIACGIIARSSGILQNSKKICACDGVTLWDERNKPLAGGNRSNKL